MRIGGLLLLLIGLQSLARADVFLLRSGGRIEGQLQNPDEIPRQVYIIETPVGVQLTLERQAVARVLRQSDDLATYLAKAPSVPDTVDRQWQLAEWCRQHHLGTQRRVHLERVIELDPDHAQARRALGYSLIDGQWHTQDQLMASRGYVRYKGRWVLPQEVEISQRNRKLELAEKEWRVRLKRYTAWLSDPDRAAEARSLIAAIDDPFAIPALRDWIASDPLVEHRQLALETIARFSEAPVVDCLVEVSLSDPDLELRRTALELIGRHDKARAVSQYIQHLKSKQNQTVNDAAYALASLGDSAAVGPLIDSLVTSHKFIVQPSNAGQQTATFVNPNSTGGATNVPNANFFGGNAGGITMGGGPKVVSQKFQNRDVLDALIALTRQNFEYDIRSWKAWFAAQQKSQSLDARRD